MAPCGGYEYRKLTGDNSFRSSALPEWDGIYSYMRSKAWAMKSYSHLNIPNLKGKLKSCVIECSDQLVDIYVQSFPWASIVACNKKEFTLSPILERYPNVGCVLPTVVCPSFFGQVTIGYPAKHT